MNFDRAVNQNPLHSSVRLNVLVFSKKSLHNEVPHWILLVMHRNILCSAKNALQIDSEETVYVYVMNEEGEILEQIKGKWSAEKWQQAIKALEVEEI